MARPRAPQLVLDIRPGSGSYGYTVQLQTRPTDRGGGRLFFTAADGEHGRELWKSNGAASGTVLVKDINPGVARLPSRVPGQHRRDAVLRGRRRRARPGALEEQRHRRRHGAGRGRQPVGDRFVPGAIRREQRDDLLRRGRRGARRGAVEERRHRGGHRPGQGHQPRQLFPAIRTAPTPTSW